MVFSVMTKLYFNGEVEVSEDSSDKKPKYYASLKIRVCDDSLGEYSEINGRVELSERKYREIQSKKQMMKIGERLEIGNSLDIFVSKVGD